jgi:anti-sigma regulatory factor (Ser/Thr protein kinase)
MPNKLRHAAPRGHTGAGLGFSAEHVYPAVPGSVPLARRQLTDTLAGWGLRAIAVVGDQVAAELLANAVGQAENASPPEILLRLTRSRCFVIIQVGDRNPAAPPRPPRKVPGQAEHGRGLLIVRALAEQVAWYEQGGWKLVWAAIRAASPVRSAGRGQLGRAA